MPLDRKQYMLFQSEIKQIKHACMQKNYVTSTPPMQNSTMSTQTNQEDIKKYNSTRNPDAVMTKNIAPFALISRISFSELSLTVSALEDS